ncbi:MAG: flagellar biosynthesis protein FlgB [Pseudomonadota bacterium]
MTILKSSLLAGLADRLSFLAARSTVISENIANADTPDYVARDLEKPAFSKLVAGARGGEPPRAVALSRSDARHIAGGAAPVGESAGRLIAAPHGDASLNGNRVSLETQTLKLSGVRMEYQLASNVYRKGLDLVRIAIRGGGRS